MVLTGLTKYIEAMAITYALYATLRPESLSFATLDSRQGAVAETPGFPILGFPAGF